MSCAPSQHLSSTLFLPVSETHPSVATEGKVQRKREDIIHKLLVNLKEMAQVLLRDAEAQQHTHGHSEGKSLGLLIYIDGLRLATPRSKCVLDYQLDLGQVAL